MLYIFSKKIKICSGKNINRICYKKCLEVFILWRVCWIYFMKYLLISTQANINDFSYRFSPFDFVVRYAHFNSCVPTNNISIPINTLCASSICVNTSTIINMWCRTFWELFLSEPGWSPSIALLFSQNLHARLCFACNFSISCYVNIVELCVCFTQICFKVKFVDLKTSLALRARTFTNSYHQHR